METCLGDLQLNWCIIYLNNIIIFAVIPKEHLKGLWAVLTKLWEAGLKLKPEKCKFFKVEIMYLSHMVSKEEVQTDEFKMKAVQSGLFPYCDRG